MQTKENNTAVSAELKEDELKQVTGGAFPTVKDEDVLNEMKLPDFNLNELQKLEDAEQKGEIALNKVEELLDRAKRHR